MKPLIVLAIFASTLAAQTPIEKTFTIPDFKVTEQSLAKAQKKLPMTFLYPPELRKGPSLQTVVSPQFCFAMHSYNFNKAATPRLVSESTCTMAKRDGFLRVGP
jgi:hypothetical protein